MKPFPFILAFIVAFVSFSADAKDESYVLGAGDSVSIQVFDEAELSGSFTVDEDGAIDYPLVGRVDVAGQTAKALDEELTQSLAARSVNDAKAGRRLSFFSTWHTRDARCPSCVISL